MPPSLVTVYDQRVSAENGCACVIVNNVTGASTRPARMSRMPDRSNESWLRQFIPVDIYGLTKQMVGAPEF